MITAQELERVEQLHRDMSERWDLCTLEGNKPVVFFLCCEDVRLMCRAAYLSEAAPMFRGTRVVSFAPKDYAFLGWAYVSRAEDREEIERTVRARGFTGEFAEIEPGTMWMLAEVGEEPERCD